MLEFRTLGTLKLETTPESEASALLAQPKRLALLAYLLLARPRGFHRRDTLLALLWPDLDQARARHALNQSLHFLRARLGSGIVTTRGAEDVGIQADAVRCDVIEFELALERDDLEGALGLYGGDLLTGFFVSDAPELERWLDEERVRLRRRALEAARVLADRCTAAARHADAVRWASRAASIEPFDEVALRRLMRALDAAGDRGGALRAYRAFSERLAAELEAEVSPETQALEESIRAREEPTHISSGNIDVAAPAPARPSETSPPARRTMRARAGLAAAVTVASAIVIAVMRYSSAVATTPAERSVAVLPFIDMSANGAAAHIADGMTEELTTVLSFVQGLHVAARTSAFAFKHKNLDVREIGRRLDVDLVLEGSIRREGDRLRVIAQLIDARNGYHIWSESYDRSMRDLFAVQDEVARAIAASLRLRLVGKRSDIYRPPTDIAAYDLYLRGRYHLRERIETRTRASISYFEQAIARDSNYARAHAGLADAYVQLAEFKPARDILPKAKAAAIRALTLDSSLVDTHLALGDLRLIQDHDWTAAEQEYRRAIALDEHSAIAHERYARYLAAARRFDEHLRETERMLEIERAEATDAIAFAVREQVALAAAFFAARRYDQAEAHGRRALELDSSSWSARAVLGRTYVEQGRYADAIRELEETWRESKRSPALARLGYAYARAGRKADAQRILDQFQARAESTYVPSDQIALLQLGLGDREAALASLERAYSEQHWWLPWINQAPPFDALREDERFLRLLRRLGVR